MIDDWAPTLTANLQTITGIEQVSDYTNIPGTISVFPSIVWLPVDGDGQFSAGGPNILHHRVRLTLFVNPNFLPEAAGTAIPFIELVIKKVLGDITLGGTVSHCYFVQPPEKLYSGPGGVQWGDKNLTGIIFNLDVKEKHDATITVAA